LTGQLEALTAAGATNIFKDKIRGARADRPQLAKLMALLQAGDLVLVTKLDRLARSTRELLDLSRLMSTLLAAIAEFERDLIRERTGEGRKRAMKAGVKFGRKPKLSGFQRKEAASTPDKSDRIDVLRRRFDSVRPNVPGMLADRRRARGRDE
jgi:DNA invertase Pin-like site-specific DNA recombinase